MFSRAFNWWNARLKSHPYSSNMIFSATVTALGDCLAQKVEKTHLAVKADAASGQIVQPSQTTSTAASSIDDNTNIRNKNIINDDDDSYSSSSTTTTTTQPPSYRTSDFNYRRTAIYGSIAFLITPVWLNVLKFTDKLVGANNNNNSNKSTPPIQPSKRTLKFRAFKQGMLTWGIGTCFVPFTVSYLTASFSVFVHGVYDVDEIKKRITERLERNFFTHISGSFCYWTCHSLPMFYYVPLDWRLVYGTTANVFWQMVVSYLQHRP